ncbi:SMP-30/gluconolactonase/LRE family protein [Sphingomonas sp. LaA6.9]|uniref:SMP-30/gluconolactonase/LRE family protein n=1 Tax=Sphingomonas sp. LaA6.9 TaxID=2919914 RepID=UPI001F4F48C8|nr:SMP-30/gluconolactonase/LRE family protein [Sphingomonas sp. LaA6.9]MCJ8157159.1 SMP-30/gluconolactonase/LRE family protein [Sphingomonas sp. LaA6.9]
MIAVHEVASGLRFPEGPVVMPDGSIVLVEIAAGRITRLHPDGSKETVAEPGGGPNGLAIGPDGLLYVCNNGGFGWVEAEGLLVPHGTAADYAGGSIQRVDMATGSVETLYTHAGDVQLRGPNDIVFDAQGGFWFTDHGKTGPRSRDVVGVFYAKADGSHIEEVIFPLENPNGIGLSPDGETLYVAETYTCKLWAFDLEGPGRVAKTPGLSGGGGRFLYSPAGYTYFDSLGVEEDGNICVATIGQSGISVISPEGQLVDFVATTDPFTTNICWGGKDRRTAYVTLSGTGRLVAIDWPRPGLKLNY